MKAWLLTALLCSATCAAVVAQTQSDDIAAAPIQVNDAPHDQVIARRFSAIMAAMAGMEAVEVTVDAGVLTLTGEVGSAQQKADAAAIAQRLHGVVHVQNQLQEPLAIRSRLAPAADKFTDMLSSAVQLLPLLLLALLSIMLFWLAGSWLSQRATLLRRLGLSELATNLGMRVMRLSITSVGILIALELLDATALVSAMLGVAGVIGIALGFAFRNIVENYLAGVLLSTRNPFAIGDSIQVDDMTGKVMRLTSRDTVLMTLDGNHLRIPNSQIITSPMTNFSRNPLRRFEFTAGVSVELDLIAVRQLAIATLQQMPGILAEPGPRVLVTELGDSNVSVHMLAWIDQRETDFLKARSEAIRLVKAAFDNAGVEMPVPTYRIHMAEVSSMHSNEQPLPTTTAAPSQAGDSRMVDVSADTTIEQQLQEELQHSDEENLLPGGSTAVKPGVA